RYDMERLILQKPRVAVRLLDALSRRLQETQSRLEETALRNATARVCRTLLRLAREAHELDVTHQELADSTGLYRETVTNALDRLQSQGLVELGKKKIVIVDKEGLEKAAEA
ncbi:MAG: Crp/Fnr family transcriptional regulator, partial [Chloroflexi bacterium]|nr:Crp/Fnr family transcriptional regulator [Chloroflexota bacterium]